MEKMSEISQDHQHTIEPFPGEAIEYTDTKGVTQKKFIWNFEHVELSAYKTLGMKIGTSLFDCVSSCLNGETNFASRIVGFRMLKFFYQERAPENNGGFYMVVEFYEER